MKLNFTETTITTLDGQTVPEVHKVLANAIYTQAKNLELVEIARKIHNGEDVELTQEQVEEVKRVINDEKTGFFAFVKAGFLDYIKNAK